MHQDELELDYEIQYFDLLINAFTKYKNKQIHKNT